MSLPAIDKVWIFNTNRRVYRPKEPGDLYPKGGPIYREHWEAHKVVGETRASWITERGIRVPKKGGRGYALSEKEVNDDIYIHDNAHRVSYLVRDCRNADLIRQIEALLDAAAK